MTRNINFIHSADELQVFRNVISWSQNAAIITHIREYVENQNRDEHTFFKNVGQTLLRLYRTQETVQNKELKLLIKIAENMVGWTKKIISEDRHLSSTDIINMYQTIQFDEIGNIIWHNEPNMYNLEIEIKHCNKANILGIWNNYSLAEKKAILKLLIRKYDSKCTGTAYWLWFLGNTLLPSTDEEIVTFASGNSNLFNDNVAFIKELATNSTFNMFNYFLKKIYQEDMNIQNFMKDIAIEASITLSSNNNNIYLKRNFETIWQNLQVLEKDEVISSQPVHILQFNCDYSLVQDHTIEFLKSVSSQLKYSQLVTFITNMIYYVIKQNNIINSLRETDLAIVKHCITEIIFEQGINHKILNYFWKNTKNDIEKIEGALILILMFGKMFTLSEDYKKKIKNKMDNTIMTLTWLDKWEIIQLYYECVLNNKIDIATLKKKHGMSN